MPTWSDSRRFHQTSIVEETSFPLASNYNNLDNFLHDIRLAVNQEKKYRRLNHLTSNEARYERSLERLSLQSFDVI